jgi:S-methylmethionine-dependent homocysteine/selenocysteine methylase
MPGYSALKERIDEGQMVILDGAIGTELQSMRVPMHPIAWCGPANCTHPATVTSLHERYIKAGVDIVTTNSFSTLRPMLEAAGYGEMVREINLRAVYHAREARYRAARERPIYIAGSMANHFPGRDPNSGALRGGTAFSVGYAVKDLADYYGEQAEVLSEAGVDFFLIESMGIDSEARLAAISAAKATGLPVWAGLTATLGKDAKTVQVASMTDFPERRAMMPNARPVDVGKSLATAVAEVTAEGVDVVTIFHTTVKNMYPAIPVVAEGWSGPIGVYPDAGRTDYTRTWRDRSVPNAISVQELVGAAKDWVDAGAQVIGACCGYGVDYITPLREALPARIPKHRRAL